MQSTRTCKGVVAWVALLPDDPVTEAFLQIALSGSDPSAQDHVQTLQCVRVESAHDAVDGDRLHILCIKVEMATGSTSHQETVVLSEELVKGHRGQRHHEILKEYQSTSKACAKALQS